MVLYSLRNVPDGLYFRVLASVLRMSELLSEWKELGESRSSCAMAATFTTTRLDKEARQFVSVDVRDRGFQVQSTSVAMLANVCGVVEGLLETTFVGMRIHTLVTFTLDKECFEVDTSKDVEGQPLSFGQILKRRLWDLNVTGKAVGVGAEKGVEKSVKVMEMLGEAAVSELKQ
eukprot:614971-Rhodomonas_salina.2